MKKAFTLLELLVVTALIGLLTAVLVPSLQRARFHARVLTVNADLRQIGLALECYAMEYKKYPPTREDCNTGMLKDHLYQLPPELARGGYLPAASDNEAVSTVMEDRFHPGHTYKYRSVGECVRDRDVIDRWITTKLWVPNGFPGADSLEEEQGQWYGDLEKSPVSWVVFSLGPEFDEQWVRDTTESRYPVSQQIWYTPLRKKGFLVRLHLSNGNEYGSFERHK